METVKTLYAIPNYECNLSCDFCNLKDKKVEYNRDIFIDALNSFQGTKILFGGEPLLYKERFKDIVENCDIDSVTTNLIPLDKNELELLDGISIATSWTPERFGKKSDYNKWLSKLEMVKEKEVIVLITLSKETIRLNPYNNMIPLFREWKTKGNIRGVLFEHLLDYDIEANYHEVCDKWLSDMYLALRKSNLDIENIIVNQLKNGWHFNCSQTYTLHPDGKITRGCPQFVGYKIIAECFSCERYNTCRPCMLQDKCTYPIKLEETIKINEKT